MLHKIQNEFLIYHLNIETSIKSFYVLITFLLNMYELIEATFAACIVMKHFSKEVKNCKIL